jgi:hypothetical protein
MPEPRKRILGPVRVTIDIDGAMDPDTLGALLASVQFAISKHIAPDRVQTTTYFDNEGEGMGTGG